jgi:hypothetical protein
MGRTNIRLEKLSIAEKVGFLGAIAGLIGIWPVFMQGSKTAKVALAVILFSSLFLLIRRRCISASSVAHRILSDATPWLVLTIVITTTATLINVWQPKSGKIIAFKDGAIFNSHDHVTAHKRYIGAFGSDRTSLRWFTETDSHASAFRYEANVEITPTGLESSGGYVVFYDDPVDLLTAKELTFECKIVDFSGKPDIGVRIAVDNPRASGDRELVCYEFSSIASVAQPDGNWRHIKIPLNQFREIVRRPPFPEGLDANKINKLVFFVNVPIAKKCPKATWWFRDVQLR